MFGVNDLECREAHVPFETDALHEPALLDATIHELHLCGKLRIPSKHTEQAELLWCTRSFTSRCASSSTVPV